MAAVSNSPQEKILFQHQEIKKLICLKIALCALSIICLFSGIFASMMLYGHVRFQACICSASFILGSLFLASAYFIKAPQPPTLQPSNLRPIQPPQQETFANMRKHITPEEDPFCIGLVNYSFIEADENRRIAKQKVSSYFQNLQSSSMTPLESGAMGIMVGMACGDSIGASYEVLPFKPEGYQPHEANNRLNLEKGQWTDDTSMGLCLADVLIQNGLDGIQLMWAFHDWWEHGYNNPFTKGEARNSVGLGGNIELAFNDFAKLEKEDASFSRNASGEYATRAGDIFTNGNGSLMRLGPVAIAAKSEKEALDFAWEQSKVTHQGDEAAGCCQLMAFLLFHALHSIEADPEKRKKMLLEKIATFQCEVPSVNDLARSAKGVKNPKTDKDENWNWQDSDFTFNPARINGCAGSYAMDGLAMALHCISTTSTFSEAITKASKRGGDADTVGAIAGQLAGALYGIENIPPDWISNIHQWDRDGEIATRGYLLCHL